MGVWCNNQRTSYKRKYPLPFKTLLELEIPALRQLSPPLAQTWNDFLRIFAFLHEQGCTLMTMKVQRSGNQAKQGKKMPFFEPT